MPDSIFTELPDRPPRSRAGSAYAYHFWPARAKGWAYRPIADWLKRELSVSTTPSNVHRFVQVRRKRSAPTETNVRFEAPRRHQLAASAANESVFPETARSCGRLRDPVKEHQVSRMLLSLVDWRPSRMLPDEPRRVWPPAVRCGNRRRSFARQYGWSTPFIGTNKARILAKVIRARAALKSHSE